MSFSKFYEKINFLNSHFWRWRTFEWTPKAILEWNRSMQCAIESMSVYKIIKMKIFSTRIWIWTEQLANGLVGACDWLLPFFVSLVFVAGKIRIVWDGKSEFKSCCDWIWIFLSDYFWIWLIKSENRKNQGQMSSTTNGSPWFLVFCVCI
jgi:hypothetical protein